MRDVRPMMTVMRPLRVGVTALALVAAVACAPNVPGSVDPTSFPAGVRPIIVALQNYGAIVGDNGAPWFISGVPDERWDNDVLATLRSIKGSDFEAVDASSLMVSPDSGAARRG